MNSELRDFFSQKNAETTKEAIFLFIRLVEMFAQASGAGQKIEGLYQMWVDDIQKRLGTEAYSSSVKRYDLMISWNRSYYESKQVDEKLAEEQYVTALDAVAAVNDFMEYDFVTKEVGKWHVWYPGIMLSNDIQGNQKLEYSLTTNKSYIRPELKGLITVSSHAGRPPTPAGWAPMPDVPEGGVEVGTFFKLKAHKPSPSSSQKENTVHTKTITSFVDAMNKAYEDGFRAVWIPNWVIPTVRFARNNEVRTVVLGGDEVEPKLVEEALNFKQ